MKKLIFAAAVLLFSLVLDFSMSAQETADKPYNDGLYKGKSTGIKKIMPYPEIREADIMWRKRIWREIDFRQKINLAFYYPRNPHDNWRCFIDVIFDALDEGRCTAYEVSTTGELITPVDYEELRKKLDITKHVVLEDREGDTTIYFQSQNVKWLRLMEDWYFDAQRSQLMVRIEAFCPVYLDDDNQPNEMCWIPFNDSTRRVLAEAPVFNRNNPHARLSYDELFWKRMFDSYIYKEENIYDRDISTYAPGLDAMFESERIKQSIIDFEQDLWEY